MHNVQIFIKLSEIPNKVWKTYKFTIASDGTYLWSEKQPEIYMPIRSIRNIIIDDKELILFFVSSFIRFPLIYGKIHFYYH